MGHRATTYSAASVRNPRIGLARLPPRSATSSVYAIKVGKLVEGASGCGWFASNPSVEAALEPAKLDQGIGKGCRDISSRFAAQSSGVD